VPGRARRSLLCPLGCVAAGRERVRAPVQRGALRAAASTGRLTHKTSRRVASHRCSSRPNSRQRWPESRGARRTVVASPFSARCGNSSRESVNRFGYGGLPLRYPARPAFCLLRTVTGADEPDDHEGGVDPRGSPARHRPVHDRDLSIVSRKLYGVTSICSSQRGKIARARAQVGVATADVLEAEQQPTAARDGRRKLEPKETGQGRRLLCWRLGRGYVPSRELNVDGAAYRR
jgi:hypothetical protein